MTSALATLVTEMRSQARYAVDDLHVAALLESAGVTDEVAREQYGSEDVFALARTVGARVRPGGSVAALPHPGSNVVDVIRRPERLRRAPSRATIGNGLIYLLPALWMPAVFGLLGIEDAVVAVVSGGALGWAWALVSTWLAYQAWTRDGEEVATALLSRLASAGTLVALAVAVIVVGALRLPVMAGLVVVAVASAQLGAVLLALAGRRRAGLALLLLPSLLGVAHLVRPSLVAAELVPATVLLCGLTALWVGSRPLRGVWSRAGRTGIGAPGITWVVVYAVTSVAFLVLPQALIILSTPAVVPAIAGLFLAMGCVEWRTARLSEGLRALLRSVSSVPEYRRRARRMFLLESLWCTLWALGCAGLVLVILAELGQLRTGGVVLALSVLPLTVAYLYAQTMANAGGYAWLALAFTLGVTAQCLAVLVLGAAPTTALVLAAGLVLGVLLTGLLRLAVHMYG